MSRPLLHTPAAFLILLGGSVVFAALAAYSAFSGRPGTLTRPEAQEWPSEPEEPLGI